jgi:hypothetical protein
VKSEPLFVAENGGLWASVPVRQGLTAIGAVVALSEGYPSGILALHNGPPWMPTRILMFGISVADGETFVVWR